MKIKQLTYNKKRNEATIYYERLLTWGKVKNDFAVFKGRIKFKGENPTEYEILEFIKLNGGIN